MREGLGRAAQTDFVVFTMVERLCGGGRVASAAAWVVSIYLTSSTIGTVCAIRTGRCQLERECEQGIGDVVFVLLTVYVWVVVQPATWTHQGACAHTWGSIGVK